MTLILLLGEPTTKLEPSTILSVGACTSADLQNTVTTPEPEKVQSGHYVSSMNA